MQGQTPTYGQDMTQWYGGAASPIQTDTIYWPSYTWTFSKDFDPSLDCNECFDAQGVAANPKCSVFKKFLGQMEILLHRDDFITRPNSYTQKQACFVYNEIRSKMGIQDKEYIIQPSEGILRSVQCVALPAIVSWLNHWISVFKIVKQCFEITMTTGESNPTVCREALSMLVCDTIFEAIKCFTNRYSAGAGGRGEGGLGIGNILGALTSAGAAVANDMQSRYGANTFFQSIFGEKRLINAICIFAFTGEWVFDLNAIVNQDLQVPINSTVLIMPAERRFVSANPLSAPPGFATYNYKIGLAIVAGSDLTFNVELICSNDYSCSPVQGYEGGRCDCVGQANPLTRSFPLTAPNSLTAGESLGVGGRGIVEYAQFEDKVRYDKVRVTWKWKSSATGETSTDSVERSIDEVGGEPPASCKWDNSFAVFRCDLGFGKDEAFSLLQNVVPSTTQYYLGENIQLTSTIWQKIPEDAMLKCSQPCKYTTYLVSTLSIGGREICAEPPTMIPAATTSDTFQKPTTCTVAPYMFSAVPTAQTTKQIGVGVVSIDPDLRGFMGANAYYLIKVHKKTESDEQTEPIVEVCSISEAEYNNGKLDKIPTTCEQLNRDGDYYTTKIGAKFKISGTTTYVDCPVKIPIGTSGQREEYICKNGENPIAAVMWMVLSAGRVASQIVDWKVELRAPYISKEGEVETVLGPSNQVIVANGQPQRKTGQLTIWNIPRPGTAPLPGTTQPTQPLQIQSVSYDALNKLFTITTNTETTADKIFILDTNLDKEKQKTKPTPIAGYTTQFGYTIKQGENPIYFSVNSAISNTDYEYVCQYDTSTSSWSCTHK